MNLLVVLLSLAALKHERIQLAGKLWRLDHWPCAYVAIDSGTETILGCDHESGSCQALLVTDENGDGLMDRAVHYSKDCDGLDIAHHWKLFDVLDIWYDHKRASNTLDTWQVDPALVGVRL